MPQCFLINDRATTHLGAAMTLLAGGSSYRYFRTMSLSRGAATGVEDRATVAGATSGIEIQGPGAPGLEMVFLSPPVDRDFTMSGTITANLWSSESNMSANVAINVVIYKIAATDNAVTQVVKSTRTTEVATTTRAVNNFTTGMTSGAYSGVNFLKGDRIAVVVFGDDAGTMGSGFTFDLGFSGTTAASDGDSYVTFAETFDFLSDTADPSGSTIYLTDTASLVATASVDKEAWTSRGGSAVTKATNTAAGPTSGIHMTDGAGGTVIDWFTRPLQAMTLGNIVKGNIRLLESNIAAQASARIQIARVDNDGTNPVVWGSWCLTDSVNTIELGTSERADIFWLSGDDLSISDGQRIRIRVLLDDMNVNIVTGHTASIVYNGPTGGASGDSFLLFSQTLTEFVTAVPNPVFLPSRRSRRALQRR